MSTDPYPLRGHTHPSALAIAAVSLALFLITSSLEAAEDRSAPRGALSGHMLGDYYYTASGPGKDQNGFQLGQIHFSYDYKWSEKFSGRFRLEAEGAQYASGERLDPYVKDAFLSYGKEGRALSAGLVGTPTWAVSERIWGYRPVEKVIMDLNGAGAPHDLGIALSGRLNGSGSLGGQLAIGNGNGNRPAETKGKKLYALLHFNPASALEATAYIDWQSKPSDQDVLTLEVLVGTFGESLHGGLEGFVQMNKNQVAGKDVQSRGLSAFGAGKLSAHLKGFARIDLFDPSDQSEDDRQYLLLAGVDFQPAANINIMPNVRILIDDTAGVDTQITPRIAGYFTF